MQPSLGLPSMLELWLRHHWPWKWQVLSWPAQIVECQLAFQPSMMPCIVL
ncbi:hypothetical protein GBA52_002683 [Prunus armeniaca]|nr:hypothetical protein GBA52_002683 [Prunus armeniaca]